jgi:hypothetical protein
MRGFAAVVLGSVAVVACAACNKSEKSAPEPAQTAGAIAIQLDTCTDVDFCQSRCDAGGADDCRRLAVTFQLGRGATKDEARAAALFEKACTLKSANACTSAGQMYEYAHGVAKDDAKAARFYETSCDGGYPPGCFNFAIMLENGRGIAQDEWKAAHYYDIACSAGAQQACARAIELRKLPPRMVDAGLEPAP